MLTRILLTTMMRLNNIPYVRNSISKAVSLFVTYRHYFLHHPLVAELQQAHSWDQKKIWAVRHKKPLLWFFIPVLWFGSGYISLPDFSRPDEPVLMVHALKSQAQTYHPTLKLQGVTMENRKVSLKSEIEGKVIEIIAAKGAFLKQGEPILRLTLESRGTELAEAEANLKQREIEYQAALKLSQKDLRSKSDVARAQANLRAAKARVEQASDRVKDTLIVAPFDGVVEDCLVEVGSSVRPSEPVALFLETAVIKAVVNPTDHDLNRILKDAHIHVKNLDGQIFSGKISFIATSADSQTRTFRVEILVENQSQELRIGIPIEADIPGPAILAHRISPAFLSLSDEGTLGVKTVSRKNVVRFRPIEIVSQDENSLWIRGLPAKTTIITDGHEYALPGKPVTLELQSAQ